MENKQKKKEKEQQELKEMFDKEIESRNKRFITGEILEQKEQKITEIFKKFQNKLSGGQKGLFLHPKIYKFKSSDYTDLFEYETIFPLKDKKEFSIIYDCLNFVCYGEKESSNAKDKDNYIEKIKNIFSILKEKGAVIFLIDSFYIEYFFQNLITALGNNYKTKLFINLYFIDTHNFLFIISIQKMGESEQPINFKDIKILITDYFSNLNSKIIGSSKLGEISNFLKEPIKKMQTYHIQCHLNYSRLNVFHPGEYFQMKLKSSPLIPDISYIVTVHDSSTNTDGKNKRTIAIVISFDITQELLFAKYFSFEQMCQHLQAGRLIVLQSAILNPLGVKELAYELKNEILLMRPKGYNEEIPIKVWEDENPKFFVYQDEKYLIRDNEDKMFSLRQLFYINDRYLQNMVQSKIRIKCTSKSKINNPPKDILYFPMETLDKFKNKGVVQCIDEYNIIGYYEKCLICTAFYLELNKLPRNTIKIMDIGAGTGVLSFYFYQLFKGCCEIDNIENNKRIYELGIKYFGLKNYDKYGNRVNWFLEDIESCIDKMIKPDNSDDKNEKKYEHKIGFYDLICNEINDINPKEDTAPPKALFSDKFLDNIKQLLKPKGIYTVNIMSKNYKSLYDNYLQLEKHFSSIFTIPSEQGLSYIFFCFNEKINSEKYTEKYKENKEIIEKNEVIEYSVIKLILNEVMSRIMNMDDEKKKLEENSKYI